MATNILAAGTGAGTSSTFYVKDRPVTISVFGTLGTDTGVIQKLASDGTTWQAGAVGGSAYEVGPDNTVITITHGGTYRVYFDGRTGSIGCDLDEAPR